MGPVQAQGLFLIQGAGPAAGSSAAGAAFGTLHGDSVIPGGNITFTGLANSVLILDALGKPTTDPGFVYDPVTNILDLPGDILFAGDGHDHTISPDAAPASTTGEDLILRGGAATGPALRVGGRPIIQGGAGAGGGAAGDVLIGNISTNSVKLGAAGIPVTLPGLTQGSVPFIGASGAITQNVTAGQQISWDNTNTALGIGTNDPYGTYGSHLAVAVTDNADTGTAGIGTTLIRGAVDTAGHFITGVSATSFYINNATTPAVFKGVVGTATSICTGAFTVASLIGVDASAANAAASTATLADAVVAALRNSNAGGTITTGNGVAIKNWTKTGAYTNSRGIFIDNSLPNTTATHYSILSQSTAPSSLTGNLILGAAAAGATAAGGVLALSNGATAPTTSVDLAHLFGKDIAAGRATLAMVTEEVVNAEVIAGSTHTLQVFLNGTVYKLMLHT